MILINGESRHRIDISDRGFQYGDGLFETVEIRNGHPVFFQQHLRRLQNGCERLGIPFTGTKLLTEEVYRLIQHSSHAVLKLMITRGSGGRGYRQPDIINPTRVITLHPFPDYPDNFKVEGIKARFCRHRLSHNPVLAGIKHMNRLEQILARAEWNDVDVHEGLMLDQNDHVIEGTMSNLFVVKEKILVTPKLDLCGIAGVIRNVVLEAAEQHAVKVEQTKLGRQEIISADELFLTNSIIGLWPISEIERHQVKIGPITRMAERWLDDCKQRDLRECSIK